MIDLHLHTSASDGRSTPEALVAEARAAGCRTIAVTDHDTVAGVAAARASAAAAGIDCVAGVEITAVDEGRDVHVLGYFIDPEDAGLAAFLVERRAERHRRVAAMADRLAGLGVPIDARAVLSATSASGRAVGRPALARALVEAGHARDIADAFDRYLAEGCPGYVARAGVSAARAVDQIRRAGGVAALAHPGKLGRDDLVASMARAGMTAIEVFHPAHTVDDIARYQRMADSLGLCVTGGSDYHGPGSGRAGDLGRVGVPPAAWRALVAHAARLRSA